MPLDVDHFKRFNDAHGHAAGDAVLRAVAAALTACLRPSDMAARYGGEELVVILPGTDLAGACAAAERARKAVCAARVEAQDGVPLPAVTVSVGAAALRGDADPDATALLARADAALYRAKHLGRDRVERDG